MVRAFDMHSELLAHDIELPGRVAHSQDRTESRVVPTGRHGHLVQENAEKPVKLSQHVPGNLGLKRPRRALVAGQEAGLQKMCCPAERMMRLENPNG